MKTKNHFSSFLENKDLLFALYENKDSLLIIYESIRFTSRSLRKQRFTSHFYKNIDSLLTFTKAYERKQQEDHDGPISLTWPNRFAYLLLKFQPSSLLQDFYADIDEK